MGKLFFDLVKFGVLKRFGTIFRVPNFFFKNHSTLIFMYMYIFDHIKNAETIILELL